MLIFVLFSCKNQDRDSESKIETAYKNKYTIIDSILPAEICVCHGDEGIRCFSLRIYKEGEKYYAENLYPIVYIGVKPKELWKAELSNAQVNLCLNYINHGMRIKNHHFIDSTEDSKHSTAVSDYYFVLRKDSIRIEGQTYYDSLNYSKLQENLFSKNYKDLEDKKIDLAKNIEPKLNGLWQVNILHKETQSIDTIILNRYSSNNKSKKYWFFGKDNTFYSTTNETINLKFSKKYKLEFYEEDMSIKIEEGYSKDSLGKSHFENLDETFDILKLDKNKIILTRLY